MTLDSIIQKTLWVHQSTLLTSVVHREQQQIHLLCVSFTCPRSHVLVPAVELMSGAGPMHAPGSCGERCAGGCHVPFAREAHQRVAWGTTSALGFTSSTTLERVAPAPQNTTQTHTYKEALQHTKSLVPHTVCDTTGALSLCSRLSELQPFQHVSLACRLLWYLELDCTVRSPLPPCFFSSSKPEDYFQVFCMASPYKTLKLLERRVHSTFHSALEQLLLAGKRNDMKLLQDCRVSGPLKLNFIYNYIAVT